LLGWLYGRCHHSLEFVQGAEKEMILRFDQVQPLGFGQ
jgi:hypothetical protein